MNENLRKLYAEFLDALGDYEGAIRENKEADIIIKRVHLTEVEKAYTTQKAADVYLEIGKRENPLSEAIKEWHFQTVKHRDIYEDKVLVGAEKIEAPVMIDLLKFCQINKLPTTWYNKAECLNLLMCLRTAKDLGLTASQINEIRRTYAMKTKSREMLEEISKNKIEKGIQSVIDMLAFNPNDKGENLYKVINVDVNYLIDTYTRKGSGLTVNTAGHKDFVKTITNMAHRIITGSTYDVGFKKSKEAK